MFDDGRQKFAAVLLDMDGVVLDSMGHHAACWQKVMNAEGLDASIEFILRNEGCLNHDVLLRLASESRRGAIGPAEAAALMDRLLATQRQMFMGQCAALARPYPEALELVAWLRGRAVPTALVTSSALDVVRAALGENLAAQFACIVTADDVRRHKPHPEPYLTAASALDLGPESCLVIENAPAGIESALAAGTTCYAVASTLAPDHLGRAHRVFADLGQVRRHLAAE